MSTWLETIMEQTAESEAPPQFYYWAGLSVLSAVVKRKIFLDKFFYKLYPNIYVLLIADSGFRKSGPINLAKNLVTNIENTRVISGSNSIQGVIKELSEAKPRENGEIITEASGFLVSEEFSTLLLEDDRAFSILTTLYDTHNHKKEWVNSLKMGKERLKEPYLTILGASNPTEFNKAVPEHALTGGFMARTMTIYAHEKGKPNPLTRRPKQVINEELLLPWVRQIASIEGEFQYESDDVIEAYDSWYIKHFHKKTRDTTGSSERIHDQILKVAMLLSLSESSMLVLTKEHIEKAIDVCHGFVINAKHISEGRGKAKYGEAIKFIVAEMIRNKPSYRVSKRKLLRNFYGQFDSADLLQIEEHLMQAQMIVKHRESDGDTLYELTEEYIKRLERLDD